MKNLLSYSAEVLTQPKQYTVDTTAPKAYFGDFGEMISNVLNIVLVIGVIAVLIYLIWGGLEWITSGGDKGKTESARNKITAAVIGLIILISAWAIFEFIQRLLGVKVIQ